VVQVTQHFQDDGYALAAFRLMEDDYMFFYAAGGAGHRHAHGQKVIGSLEGQDALS
jgi:hypothetical protein